MPEYSGGILSGHGFGSFAQLPEGRLSDGNRGHVSDGQMGDKRLVLAHPSDVRRRNCSQPAQVAPIGCPGNGGEPPTVHDDLGAEEYEGQSLTRRVEEVAG